MKKILATSIVLCSLTGCVKHFEIPNIMKVDFMTGANAHAGVDFTDTYHEEQSVHPHNEPQHRVETLDEDVYTPEKEPSNEVPR